MSVFAFLFIIFLVFPFGLHANSFRTVIENNITVTTDNLRGVTAQLGLNGSVVINLGDERRFFRGIELELSAPQNWLRYRNSIAMEIHNNLTIQTSPGGARINAAADVTGNRIASEALPNRLRMVYHIPMRTAHGLRTTPYATVPSPVIAVNSFPIIFSLSPLTKVITSDLENMRFNLTVRPILSDEGAVRLITRFPASLPGRPFTVLINDDVISDISQQVVLREGEHHLVVLSEDYRNISRRFLIERGRVHDLIIELQDTTPILIFEGPQNANIFLNDSPVNSMESVAVEPGLHEIKYQMGDYTIVKTLNVQRGRSYRIALTVDILIQEID